MDYADVNLHVYQRNHFIWETSHRQRMLALPVMGAGLKRVNLFRATARTAHSIRASILPED